MTGVLRCYGPATSTTTFRGLLDVRDVRRAESTKLLRSHFTSASARSILLSLLLVAPAGGRSYRHGAAQRPNPHLRLTSTVTINRANDIAQLLPLLRRSYCLTALSGTVAVLEK